MLVPFTEEDQEMGSDLQNLRLCRIFVDIRPAFFRRTLQLGIIFFLMTALPSVSVFCGQSIAGQTVDCVQPKGRNSAGGSFAGVMVYHEDRSLSQSFEDLHNDPEIVWKPLRVPIPSFGFSNSAYWLKFNVCLPEKESGGSVLEITYPLIDHIQVIGVINEKIVYNVESGDSLPYSYRPVKHRNFVFFLPGTEEIPLTLYLRVQTKSAMQIPLRLFTEEGFFHHNQEALLLQGLYFGIILAMVLYNGFLFVFLRELPYLLYILFTSSYFSFQGVFQGVFQQFLFDSVWLQNHSLLFFGFLSIVFANWFALSFLKLRVTDHLISRILRIIGWVSTSAALFASIFPYEIMVKLMLTLAIPSSLLILAAGCRLWYTGHRPARIFTVAWSTLLISFVLASFNKIGLVPRIFWTENILQIGGLLEVVLLSIALAERVNEEKRQRILAEQRLSTSLEEKVQERTMELNKALAQLEEANSVLSEISQTDSLTQTGNRRSFDIQLAHEFKSATRLRHSLALIMLDIDHFKKFNDRYGHQCGDMVLQVVATRLKEHAARPGDSVYRYGGEEFAVVLNNTELSGAIIVAEKMRKAIETTAVRIEEESLYITLSAGICTYSPLDDAQMISSPEELIQNADMQLYKAKEKGRNRIEVLLRESPSSQ